MLKEHDRLKETLSINGMMKQQKKLHRGLQKELFSDYLEKLVDERIGDFRRNQHTFKTIEYQVNDALASTGNLRRLGNTDS